MQQIRQEDRKYSHLRVDKQDPADKEQGSARSHGEIDVVVVIEKRGDQAKDTDHKHCSAVSDSKLGGIHDLCDQICNECRQKVDSVITEFIESRQQISVVLF